MTGSRTPESGLPGVGVFGTGTPARRVIPLLRTQGFKVEAVWGRTMEEAELLARDLSIGYATNRVDDVLLRKDVGLVVILCPPAHHSQIAVKALGIGKHVAVQSPGGLNQDETLRMVQAAQYYPRLTATVCAGLRFLPAFAKMRRAVASGLIGPDVTVCDVRLSLRPLVGKRFSWLCDEGMGGGALSLLGSQLVDLLHFLTGGRRAVRVHGVLRTFTRETDTIRGIRRISADDFAAFQMEMEGGTFASVTIDAQLCGFSQEVTLAGAEGHLVARNGSLFHCRRGGTEEEPLYLDEEDGDVSQTEGGDDDVGGGDDPLFSGIYLRGLGLFFRRLAQGFRREEEGGQQPGEAEETGEKAPPLATFDDAQYVQSVLESTRRSSRQRAWTQVTQKTQEELPLSPKEFVQQQRQQRKQQHMM